MGDVSGGGRVPPALSGVGRRDAVREAAGSWAGPRCQAPRERRPPVGDGSVALRDGWRGVVGRSDGRGRRPSSRVDRNTRREVSIIAMGEPSSAFRTEQLSGWGMSVGGPAQVARPSTRAAVAAAMALVAETGGSLALRGAGCSYGDASLNRGGYVLDLGGMDRVLAFDRERGVITVEPGVTVRDVWRQSIRSGWWPPVVPGTMAVSVGGATAFNIHGKNNFAVGTFGDHVQSFVLLTATGDVLRCSRQENADLFHAAIGGFGMLGCIVEVTLQLKRVHSGRLRVWAIPTRDLADNLRRLEELKGAADYLVGWLDLHPQGRGARPRPPASGRSARARRGSRRRRVPRSGAPGCSCPALRRGAEGMAVARHVGGDARRWRGRRQRPEVPGRLSRRPGVAVPAEPRRLPLPARLRAALALDDETRRPPPVPTVRSTARGRGGAAAADRTLPAGAQGAVSRRPEAPPARSVPDDARGRWLLPGDGLRRRHRRGGSRGAVDSSARKWRRKSSPPADASTTPRMRRCRRRRSRASTAPRRWRSSARSRRASTRTVVLQSDLSRRLGL